MTKLLRLVIAITVAVTLHQTAVSQSLSVNTDGSTAHASALLDVKSTAKGVLVPRMSKTQKGIIPSPATGLLIFQDTPDSIGFHYYDGTRWVMLDTANANSGLGWLTIGNAGTDSAVNFLGTLDDKPLMLRQNNLWMGQLNTKQRNYFVGAGAGRNTVSGLGNNAFGDSALYNVSTGGYNTAIGNRSMLGSGAITGGVNVAVGNNSLANITSGSQNVALGDYAAASMKTGTINVIIGAGAMESATKGNGNIGMGLWASRSNDSASNTLAIGTQALYYNKKDNNVAVGFNAGTNVDLQPVTNPQNEITFIGTEAGYGFWAGSKSTALGYRALYNSNNGTVYGSSLGRNTAIGDSAMAFTYSSRNVAIGTEALSRAQISSQNVAIGDSSLGGAVSTTGNVGIGYKTLSKQVGQGWNTAVGYFSQRDSSVNTYYNTSIGAYSMEYNRTGIYNTGLGLSALRNSDSASYNTAIGADAMYFHTTGNFNTAVGMEAMQNDSAGYTNVAVGWRSLRNHKVGGDNVAIGVGALELDSSGNNNTAVGRSSQFFHKRGNWNTSIGISSAQRADTAYEVTAIGTQAAFYNKVPYTTAVGTNALLFNNVYTNGGANEGKENTAVGQLALHSNTIGTKNTAVGYHALNSYSGSYWFTSSNRNTAVGDSAATATVGQDNVAIGNQALTKNFTGSQHVAVGSRALLNTTAGYPNTAVGYSSQDSATTGFANTAIGTYSLMKNKLGYNNTAIGNAAMMEAYNASATNYMYDNTAVGNDALRFARYNGQTAIGAGALRNDTAGVYNTAVGYLAMYENKTGTVNTAIGTSALRFDTSGSGNTALGVNSLFSHRTGNNNVAVGYNTLFYDIDGGANTAIGNYAMHNHKTNGLNTAVGYESMYYDTAGSVNTALGWRSLRYVKHGIENTALGVGANEFTDSSYYNTSVGRGSFFVKGGKENTSIGFYSNAGTTNGLPAGSNYYVDQTTTLGTYAGYRNFGDQNTFVGYRSGFGGGVDSIYGIENTGIGSYTLYNTTSGKSNTALGFGSLLGNTTGNGNVAIGIRTLYGPNTGSYNVAIGDSAMYGSNASGNTAIGTFALRFNNTGAYNTTVGNYSLLNNSNGSRNVSLGDSALYSNVSGSTNTGVGYLANTSASNLSNATAIGANAFVAQSNSMVLGSISGINSATSDTKVGIGTTTPDSALSIADKFLVGSSGTAQFDNSVPTMMYMFKSGSTNADRMVVAHSPSFPSYGLQYQDLTDRFNFLSGGNPVLTADLGTSRVGVGTVSPQKKLHVFNGTSGAVTNASSQILMEDDATSYFEMSTPAAGENGIISSIPLTGIRSAIIFGANNSLKLRSGGNFDRLYIDNAGFTGINRTPTTTISSGTLQVQSTSGSDDIFGIYNSTGTNRWTYYTTGGDLFMYNNAVLRGTWSSINGVYTSSSDRGLKKDIAELPVGVLSKINNLKSYNFRYNDNKSTDPLTIGFMAQDVQPLFPEAVTELTNKDGSKSLGLKYQYFGVYAIKAIQEQQQIIDKQQKQIEDLLLRVSKLENK